MFQNIRAEGPIRYQPSPVVDSATAESATGLGSREPRKSRAVGPHRSPELSNLCKIHPIQPRHNLIHFRFFFGNDLIQVPDFPVEVEDAGFEGVVGGGFEF